MRARPAEVVITEAKCRENSVVRKALSILRLSFVSVLFLALILSPFVSVTAGERTEDEAASALAGAETEMILAYQALLMAEEAGADVSDLLAQLNESAEFLTQARMAFQSGNFDEAVTLAAVSRNIGLDVQGDSASLKNLALSENLRRMMFAMTASMVSIALIALGSFWVWRILKRSKVQPAFV